MSVSFTAPVIAGALVRRHVRPLIESYADANGVGVTIRESRGWLSSTFYVTMRGEAESVRAMCRKIDEFISN